MLVASKLVGPVAADPTGKKMKKTAAQVVLTASVLDYKAFYVALNRRRSSDESASNGNENWWVEHYRDGWMEERKIDGNRFSTGEDR